MSNNLNIPWHRYALIIKLAEELQSTAQKFGKTALQKMVYLFQEIYKVNCGYRFKLYTYGPFTAELLSDLDYIEHIGGVTVTYDDSSNGGYDISPGKEKEYLLSKGRYFINDPEVQEKLPQLIAEFGHFRAVDLELRSTIVYAVRDLQADNSKTNKEEVIQVVQGLKPRFPEDEIRQTVDELLDKGFISFSQ